MSEEPRRRESGDEPWDLEPRSDEGASAPAPHGGGKGSGEPGARPHVPRAKLEAEPILELEEEACPKCGAPLGPGEVVCMKCGYDMHANTVRRVEHRVEHVEEAGDGEEAREEFVTPGRGSPKTLVIVGTIVGVAAMITAGVGVPPGGGGWLVVASVLLVVYEVVLHTGTGLVAVSAAARISEERFGGEEAVALAAARVFVAMAVFELVLNLVAFTPYVGPWVAWPVAGGAYWLVVWGLFNKTKTVALVIVLAQVILWLLVRMGMELAAWREGALAAIP